MNEPEPAWHQREVSLSQRLIRPGEGRPPLLPFTEPSALPVPPQAQAGAPLGSPLRGWLVPPRPPPPASGTRASLRGGDRGVREGDQHFGRAPPNPGPLPGAGLAGKGRAARQEGRREPGRLLSTAWAVVGKLLDPPARPGGGPRSGLPPPLPGGGQGLPPTLHVPPARLQGLWTLPRS